MIPENGTKCGLILYLKRKSGPLNSAEENQGTFGSVLLIV